MHTATEGVSSLPEMMARGVTNGPQELHRNHRSRALDRSKSRSKSKSKSKSVRFQLDHEVSDARADIGCSRYAAAAETRPPPKIFIDWVRSSTLLPRS